MDEYITKICSIKDFKQKLKSYKDKIIERSDDEIIYYKNEMNKFKNLSKEEAIKRLIKETKLEEKLNAIRAFISKMGLNDE